MTSQADVTIDELLENFEFLGDWEQRFTYLLDLGKKLPLAGWFAGEQREGRTVSPATAAGHLKNADESMNQDVIDRYAALFDEANRVHGCQATVYLKQHVVKNGEPRIEFDAVADAFLVNGLIAILRIIYNDKTAKQVVETDIAAILKKLDLEEHLSPTRRNGLHAMVQRIQSLAAAQLSSNGS